jgi:hypothetical protein
MNGKEKKEVVYGIKGMKERRREAVGFGGEA